MTRLIDQERAASDRRRFERVDIAQSSQVVVLEEQGKRVGVLRQIGRGGFMMEPEKPYSKDGTTHKLTIHEPGEQMQIEIKARVVYVKPDVVGFEFVDLDVDAAVEVGIIIGKYYEHEKSENL
jgi:c-di-GMP-binding flagellar brake protein YcgR